MRRIELSGPFGLHWNAGSAFVLITRASTGANYRFEGGRCLPQGLVPFQRASMVARMRPKRFLVGYLLLFGLLLGAYWGVLSAGFVWLDHLEIVQGGLIVDDWSGVLGLFANDGNFGGYHRPFYNLLHSLDRAMWGLDPKGFHLSSILLHGLNGVLLLALCKRLSFGGTAAFVVAALWILHPVNTAVAGLIHSKADLFVTTMGLSSILLCIRALDRSSRAPFLGAGLCFLVALLTKELAFALPIGLSFWAWREKRMRPFAAASWMLLLAIWVYRSSFAASEAHELAIGHFEAFKTFTVVYVDYARRLFLPFDPSICDTVTVQGTLGRGTQLGYFIALVIWGGAQALAWRKQPELRKWILVYNLALLPVSQFIVPSLHFRADRFLYVPSLALIAGCVEGCLLLAKRPGFALITVNRIALTAGLLIGATFFAKTRSRLRDFQSDETLFLSEIARTPDYLEGLAGLAAHYDRIGEFERASNYFQACLEGPIRGDGRRRISYIESSSFLVNFSFNLIARQRPGEAKRLLRENWSGIKTARAREQASYNLAVCEYRERNFDAALPLLTEYAASHPADASCRYLLGVSAMELGQRDLARDSFRVYLELAPQAPDRDQVEGFLKQLGP